MAETAKLSSRSGAMGASENPRSGQDTLSSWPASPAGAGRSAPWAPPPYVTMDVGCQASFHTYILDRDGRKIGVVWGPAAEKVWTAALFVAAPELLAALKAMLHQHGRPMREEWLNDSGFEEAKRVDAQARAAIAKATGGTG